MCVEQGRYFHITNKQAVLLHQLGILCWITSVVSDSVPPHRWQPTRLPRLWDSPDKNTGLGCHFLLQFNHDILILRSSVKSLRRAWLGAIPWTAAYQAPPSLGFSKQEYWSGVPLPSLKCIHCRCCQVTSVAFDSVWPHRRQPTRLPHPWDSPGKNTGVGCHFLLQCMKVKSESEVAQSCPTLSDPMVCSLPGSSVHGIFQARVLEWGAIAFFKTYEIRLLKFS